jgi:hypothetical protein
MWGMEEHFCSCSSSAPCCTRTPCPAGPPADNHRHAITRPHSPHAGRAGRGAGQAAAVGARHGETAAAATDELGHEAEGAQGAGRQEGGEQEEGAAPWCDDHGCCVCVCWIAFCLLAGLLAGLLLMPPPPRTRSREEDCCLPVSIDLGCVCVRRSRASINSLAR